MKELKALSLGALAPFLAICIFFGIAFALNISEIKNRKGE